MFAGMAAPKLELVVTQSITLLEATQNFVKQSKVNAFVNLSQSRLQNILYGSIFAYRYGNPDTPISPQVTSDAADLMMPFWRKEDLTLTSGQWEFPIEVERFGKLIDLRCSYDDDVVSSAELLANTQYMDRLVSTSKPPTEREPIAEYARNAYVANPVPNSLSMLYYEAPAPVVIPYVDGEPDFSSIPDILWPDRALSFLVYLFVSNFGVPLNNPQMVQTGQQLAMFSI